MTGMYVKCLCQGESGPSLTKDFWLSKRIRHQTVQDGSEPRLSLSQQLPIPWALNTLWLNGTFLSGPPVTRQPGQQDKYGWCRWSSCIRKLHRAAAYPVTVGLYSIFPKSDSLLSLFHNKREKYTSNKTKAPRTQRLLTHIQISISRYRFGFAVLS